MDKSVHAFLPPSLSPQTDPSGSIHPTLCIHFHAHHLRASACVNTYLQLLELIEPLKRGLVASEEDQEQVEALVQQLEKMNPTPKPLESPLLNGRWELVRHSWGSEWSVFVAHMVAQDSN